MESRRSGSRHHRGRTALLAQHGTEVPRRGFRSLHYVVVRHGGPGRRHALLHRPARRFRARGSGLSTGSGATRIPGHGLLRLLRRTAAHGGRLGPAPGAVAAPNDADGTGKDGKPHRHAGQGLPEDDGRNGLLRPDTLRGRRGVSRGDGPLRMDEKPLP